MGTFPSKPRQMITLLVNDLSVATSNRQILVTYYGRPHQHLILMTSSFLRLSHFPTLFCDSIHPIFLLTSVHSCSIFFCAHHFICYFPGSNRGLTTCMWITSVHSSLLVFRLTYTFQLLTGHPHLDVP